MISTANPSSTPAARLLLSRLYALRGKAMLFGHQNTEIEGRKGWHAVKGGWELPDYERSDLIDSVGDYPALYGYDFKHYGHQTIPYALQAARRGGVLTYSWHVDNPVNKSNAWDCSGPLLKELLPGGSLNQYWLKKLREIAQFMQQIQIDGEAVPIIFRPFHEHTGGWFWWGAEHNAKEDFIAAFRYTVQTLQQDLGQHQLLIAYSPADPSDMKGLTFDYYPGDDVIDIIAFDRYPDDENPDSLGRDAAFIGQWAEQRGKLGAIGEMGAARGNGSSQINDWYQRAFLSPILADNDARQLVFCLVWRNACQVEMPEHYWVPLPGDPMFATFKETLNSPYLWLQKDWSHYAKQCPA